MKTNNKLGLLALALASVFATNAAIAAEDTSTLTVSATLTTACEVSAASSMSFGSFAALASSGDKTADTGSTFQVACSADASPTIYSATARTMSNGTDTLPFNLSLTAGAATNSLATASGTADALTVTQDGDLHDVVIYGKTHAADFKDLSSGAYSASIVVAVAY